MCMYRSESQTKDEELKDSNVLNADTLKPTLKSESTDEDQVEHWVEEKVEKPKEVKIAEEAVKPDEVEPRQPTPVLPTRK